MNDWAAKVHKKATSFGNVMTSCSYLSEMHLKRIEKVKFAAPFPDVCKQDDLPAPLLVLILKLNKEAPIRKDIFRAPGHLTSVNKLIHYLENGILVNIENFSVYTIASVLKKFLRKIPNGIFGVENEQLLFNIITLADAVQKSIETKRLILSLPKCTQKLLVVLFGTFRVIALNSARYNTGMTSEAIGVSVAPSFFRSCVSNGKIAKMEDVLKFKTATQIVQMLIENFSTVDIFGHHNYEYYTAITGRILKVENEWICSFLNPSFSNHFYSQQIYSGQLYSEDDRTWLQCECARWRNTEKSSENLSKFDECHSLPSVATTGQSSLSIVPDFMLEPCTRLSVSLQNNSESSTSNHSNTLSNVQQLKLIHPTAAGGTRSLSFLPSVHEKQTERMRNRSRWFLTPPVQCKNTNNVLSASADSICQTLTKEKDNLANAAKRCNIVTNINNRTRETGLFNTNKTAPLSNTTSSSLHSSTSVKRKLKRSGHVSNSLKIKLDENNGVTVSSGVSLIRSSSCKQAKISDTSITKSNSFNDRFCKCSMETFPKMDQVPFVRISLT